MTREQARQEMKSRFAEYLKPAKKRGTYICPLCGNGTGDDGDGMSIDPHGDRLHLKCFKCGFYGDIIDVIKEDMHLGTDAEAFAAARDFFKITIDDQSAPARKVQKVKNAQAAQEVPQVYNAQEVQAPDFTSYFKTMAANITSSAAAEYLSYRHISLETAQRFMLGFDMRFTGEAEGQKKCTATPWRALVIPTSKESYVARNTDTNAGKGDRYRKVGQVHLFNAQALKRDAGRALFITEGEINALSIIEAGGDACALGSTSNVEKFTAQLKASGRPVIVALDNDDAGKKAAEKLVDALKRADVKHTVINVYGDHNDANDALRADSGAFAAAISAAEMQTTATPDGIGSYIQRLMPDEIKTFNAASNIRTGFDVLDAKCGGLFPGLYAVGAISSLGKTTFMHQIADQIAAAGTHVLFFSLEQSRLEMASKSLSRMMAQRDYNNALDSLKIRRGVTSKGLDAAISDYTARVGDRLSVIEADFDCTVATVSDYVNRYINQNGVRPVVILDYLQILQAAQERSGQRRDDIDANVTELKRLSRAKNVPVLVISSINRNNYLMPVDFESFKESGGIEYTADVVLGLQLECLEEDLFRQEKKILEKRKRVKEAKEATPREIRLVCLKNRYGGVDWHTNYKYYPAYDLFEEVTPDGFTVTHEPTPFDT